MELSDVIRARRMVRHYRPDPVDHAVLAELCDLARRAPSAGNTQAVTFVVVTDAARRSQLAALCGEAAFTARGLPAWLGSAPAHVIVCTSAAAYRSRYAEPDKARARGPRQWTVPFWWVDAGAALMTLLLAAVDRGLAGGFLDLADPARVRELLGIPDDVAPVGLVTLGHDAGDGPVGSARRPRRPLDEVVRWQSW